MPATITTAAPFIRPNVQNPAVDSVFRGTDLINVLASEGRIVSAQGSSPFKWNTYTAANATAAIFSEGDALSTFGNQTSVQASQPAFYVRAAGSISGHLRDNIIKGGTYEDVRQAELDLAIADMYKFFEDSLVGSVTDVGIASIIDSTTVYAGIDPAVNTAWASYEDNLAGALTVTAMQNLYENVVNTPYGATPTHFLMNPGQVTNYINASGAPGSANSAYRIVPGAQGGAFDSGVVMPLVTFNGLPVVSVRGLSTTEVYAIDISKLELLIHREPTVTEIAVINDDNRFMVTIAGCLKASRRRSFGKLTGVTA